MKSLPGRWCSGLLVACVLLVVGARAQTPPGAVRSGPVERPPNLVFLMADDLGYGEVGCYGQQKIRTPNIDRLAQQGMRFTRAYCGAPVCAPSRCVLMTGHSSPFAEIRDNQEVQPEGQLPISKEVPTIASMLHGAGYVCGAFGKWGLGPVGSTGDPNRKGFDRFFGYNCQRQAHTYFPQYLWLDSEQFWLDNPVVPGHGKIENAAEGFAQFRGNEYAPDLILRAAKGFVRAHQKEPFFLYVPFIQPHVAMQPPPALVDSYPREWDDKPYLGEHGYVPHPRPHAGYAAMITDLDDQVGELLSLIDELGLGENTLVVFTSDNGPTHDVGGVDTGFFDSAGPLRGRKGSVFEGGLRVPFIARWTGKIAAGTTSPQVVAFQDVMASYAELAAVPVPAGCDGVSFVPTLLGDAAHQRSRDALVFEFRGYGGQKAVWIGDTKAVMRGIEKGGDKIEVYDLAQDIGETRDIADQRPDFVDRARRIFRERRSPSANFPLHGYDGG